MGKLRTLTLAVLATLVVATSSSAVRTEGSGSNPFEMLPFRYIGPPGNRINAVAGVAGDPNVIYAGAASGGVFKSVDGGLHWRPIFDDQHVASIGALAVAPTDPNVVWAGTGDPNIRPNIEIGDGAYRSTDGGTTWTHMGLDKTGRIGRIAIDPRNAAIVFVAAMGHCYGPQQERGLYRTRDGGRTWERVLFVDENTGAIDVIVDPKDSRTVFAATWQLVIHPWTSENGGPGSGIHVSHDGGTTWTRLKGNGLPGAPLGRITVGIAPSNTKRIYALIETADQGNLWRSDDGGRNWSVASRDAAINRRARYFGRLGVAPDNPDEVYFLAQSIYVSHDGGATTKVIPELFPDHHDIWFDPTNANRILVANDRYVNVSTTRGLGWLHASLPNAQINRVAVDRRIPYNVYGSRQDGPSYRGPSNSLVRGTGAPPLDNGTGIIAPDFWIWTIGSESGWTMPDGADDNVIWASSANNVQHVDMRTGSLLGSSPWPRSPSASRSAEGGPAPNEGQPAAAQPVAERPFRLNWTIPLAMSPHDPHTVYAGSQFVHRSSDGGSTWEVISPDLTTNDKTKQQVPKGLWPETQDVPSSLIAIEESPIERGVIWTGSNDGIVSLTRDGGRTWSNVSSSIPGLQPWGFVNSVTPSRHKFGGAYVTVDRHRAADNATYVFKTEDYGRSWKSIGAGIPQNIFSYARVLREDPRRAGMLYLGTENSLYVSVDDGATWLPLQGNLPHSPIAWLTVQKDFDDLVVATWGRGIWILDDISPLQQLTPEVMRARGYLFEPRPAYLFALRAPTTTESFASEFDTPSNAGRNPPYGAPITYHLSAELAGSGPATLTIRNEKGETVRTLPNEPHAPGLNRVWWDLRSDVARTAPQSQQRTTAASAGAGRRPAHPLVAPGNYTITLAIGGQEFAAKLGIRRDPVTAPNN